jgi:hypothetical protein
LGQLGCFYQHLGAISGLSQNRKINVSKESELTLMLPNSQGCFFTHLLGPSWVNLGVFMYLLRPSWTNMAAVIHLLGQSWAKLGAFLQTIQPTIQPTNPNHQPNQEATTNKQPNRRGSF